MGRVTGEMGSRHRWLRGARHKFLVSAGAVIATVAFSPAYAQTDGAIERSAAAEDAAENNPDIVVTGSLLGRGGFNTPTPVTSLGTAEIQRIAAPNIADAINQLPAVRASLTPASTVNLGSLAGGNFIDLRGMGYQRTQILIDGRRYVPTTPSGGVSISTIPQALIRGVDVVTGGASATYGSDAVAGVVNLLIDNKFDGIKGSLQGGITDHDDYRNFLLSVAVGTAISDRLHLTVAGEASQNSGIDFIGSRGWGAANPGIIANPAYTATNSQPRYIIASNVRAANASYGGVINSPGLLRGIQFTPNGQAVPFNYGSLVSTSTMVGGDGANTSADGVGLAPVKRYSGFAHLDYEISNDLSVFVEGSYSQVKSRFLGLPGSEQITIRADNAFLPDSIRNTMATNNIPSFTLGRAINDNARTITDIDIRSLQLVTGVKAKLSSSWVLDAYYSYGSTDNRSNAENSRITSRFNQAIDAVKDPLTGAAICRSTLTTPGNGCVPLNLIGQGNASPSALAWVNGVSERRWKIDQHVVDATVRGELFDFWGGPVSLAVGGEYREQKVVTTSDAISAVQGYRNGGTIPYQGKVSVKEAFGELLIPFAVDQSWAKDLTLDLAARVTDYSTSGTVATWKVGINYAINDSLRLRATRSRDIRAPSLEELFQAGATSNLNVSDPVIGEDYLVTAANRGNPGLQPEKADSFTAGIVLTPTAIRRLKLSIDYYNIKLNSAIIALTPASIVTQCYTTAPQLCSLITRGADNRITRVQNGPVNLQSVLLRGVDVEVAYPIPVGRDELSLRALVSYTAKAEIYDGVTRIRLDNSVDQPTIAALGGSPNWRFNVSGNYIAENYRVSLAGRYVGGGHINNAFTDKDIAPDQATVKGRLYLDLSGEHSIVNVGKRKISLFGTIQNLLNQDPPITGVGGYGTTRALYDTIGRIYTIGARFSL